MPSLFPFGPKPEDEELTVYVEFEDEFEAEQRNLFQWRCDLLEHAGVAHAVAKKLARRRGVDVHKAEEMKKNGCEDKLLLRICR